MTPKAKYHCYIVTNTINGKQYVGKSKGDPSRRWRQHISHAFNPKCRAYNNYLERAIRKYSPKNFTHEVIFWTDNENEVFAKEVELIKKYHARAPRGYNLTDGAEGNSGWIPSETTRKKLSKASRGKNNHFYGKHQSSETRKKISKATQGKNNPFYGKYHSSKTKRKLSGENNGRAKLTEKQVRQIHKLYMTGEYTYKQLSKMLGVSYVQVFQIVRRKSWKHVK